MLCRISQPTLCTLAFWMITCGLFAPAHAQTSIPLIDDQFETDLDGWRFFETFRNRTDFSPAPYSNYKLRWLKKSPNPVDETSGLAHVSAPTKDDGWVVDAGIHKTFPVTNLDLDANVTLKIRYRAQSLYNVGNPYIVSNLYVRVTDADQTNSSPLFSARVSPITYQDTKWQIFTKNFDSTELPSGVQRIRVELFLGDDWIAQWNQSFSVDSFSLTLNLSGDTPPDETDIDEVDITGETTDSDGDGVFDNIDLDDDNDGIPDAAEGANGANPVADDDNDDIPNYLDPDSNDCADTLSDGVCDSIAPAFDANGDGVPNHQDLDSDGDGVTDLHEAGNRTDSDNDGRLDCDGGVDSNGLCDEARAAPAPIDSNQDGIPDFLDPTSGNDDSSNDDSSNDDSSNDDDSNDDNSNDDSTNDDSTNDDSSNDGSSNDDDSNDDNSNDDSTNDDSTNDDSTNDDSTNDDSSNDGSSNDDNSNDDSSNDDSSNDDSTNDDSSNDDDDSKSQIDENDDSSGKTPKSGGCDQENQISRDSSMFLLITCLLIAAYLRRKRRESAF